MNTIYALTTVTDLAVTAHGWTHEIVVYVNGENTHSKLYRDIRSARNALDVRSGLAIQGGNAGDVTAVDNTL